MTCTAVIMAQRALRSDLTLARWREADLPSFSIVGCYVPATRARISPIDAIYSRMGANDFIFANASTFKVEMDDCNKILQKVRFECVLLSPSVRADDSPPAVHATLAGHSRRIGPRHVDVRRHGHCLRRFASPGNAHRLHRLLRDSFHVAHGGLCCKSLGNLPSRMHGEDANLLPTTLQYHPE